MTDDEIKEAIETSHVYSPEASDGSRWGDIPTKAFAFALGFGGTMTLFIIFLLL